MNTTADNSLNQEKHIPGEPGVWVFITGDILVFSLMFGVYMYYRSMDVAGFNQSQLELNANYGAINTLLLLTSSLFVVMALQALRNTPNHLSPAKFLNAPVMFSLALLCGLGFSIIKFVEYGEKISHGITLTSNNFYMFYYVLTGIHFLHVIIGMCMLFYFILRTRKISPTDKDMMFYEGGCCFWHMVDLLWIILFPLLYIIR